MSENVQRSKRLDKFLDRLVQVIGHADRHGPLRKYCTGLLLPDGRKSVEPMAERISPGRVSAEHQSMLHFVGQAPWKDDAVLREVREYALPTMLNHGPIDAWIIDDTGLPKKGKHSVGVANQYCGVLGKNHNCQVSVSVSVANDETSLPVAHRLYLPKSWAEDAERRKKAKVPEDIEFATKPEIALKLVDKLLDEDPMVPRGTVLADPGYGDSSAFRQGLTDRGLPYVVGVSETISVWPPGKKPLPPKPQSGRRGGRPQTRLQHSAEHHPVSAKELAMSLPPEAWHTVTWREGTDGDKTSRFARARVRPARNDRKRSEPRPEEWLLIEWPEDAAAPTKYWLSTEDEDITLTELVRKAKLRWRIERDHQELKQEVGFGHYEGRGWRGFHHHTTLCIAAYAFLLAERARLSPPGARAQPPVQAPPLPEGFRRRGAPPSRAAAPADVDTDDDARAGA